MTRQRAYQLRKLAAGLCQQCGRRPLQSTTMCNECLLKLSSAAHRRYHHRKALKVCIYCGQAPLASTTSCASCVAKKQALREEALNQLRAVQVANAAPKAPDQWAVREPVITMPPVARPQFATTF